MTEHINQRRRLFTGSAAMTIATAQFGLLSSTGVQSGETRQATVAAIKRGGHEHILQTTEAN